MYLEFQLHASDMLSALNLGQLLDVGIEAPGGHLSVATGHCLQQGIVDEAVLVLRLHHVVPLWPHQRHVAVNVDRLLVLDTLKHGVDDDKAARPPDSGAAGGFIGKEWNLKFKGRHTHKMFLFLKPWGGAAAGNICCPNTGPCHNYVAGL